MREPGDAITVENLNVIYQRAGMQVHAVRDVSIALAVGESLGIVGESGSGKSTLGLSLLRLLPPSAYISGTIDVDGVDVLAAPSRVVKAIRGKAIGLVYQDALAALNPVRRVGPQIAEVMTAHLGLSGEAARSEAIDALSRVGISDAAQRYRQFPHEFSGGMRQRAAIAMALAAEPKVLLADEPTTALDVTVQAQIVRLLRDLRERLAMAMIVISHDLGVVRETADRIAVMYHGAIVETGRTADILANPQHPYTRDLIRSAPTVKRPVIAFIPGAPPRPGETIIGCAFEPRCSVGRGSPLCRGERPLLRSVHGQSNTLVACHFPLSASRANATLLPVQTDNIKG